MKKFMTAVVYALGALCLILGFAVAGMIVYVLSFILYMFGVNVTK